MSNKSSLPFHAHEIYIRAQPLSHSPTHFKTGPGKKPLNMASSSSYVENMWSKTTVPTCAQGSRSPSERPRLERTWCAWRVSISALPANGWWNLDIQRMYKEVDVKSVKTCFFFVLWYEYVVVWHKLVMVVIRYSTVSLVVTDPHLTSGLGSSHVFSTDPRCQVPSIKSSRNCGCSCCSLGPFQKVGP